jgi:hypothetical protein
MARYSSPRDLLEVPGFEHWAEYDDGTNDRDTIARKLKFGVNVIVWPYKGEFAAAIVWDLPFPTPFKFKPTPEGAKGILEWASWVAQMSGGWFGEDAKEVISKLDSYYGAPVPECLIENRKIVRPKFMEAFRDGLSENGLSGVAVIADPSDASVSCVVVDGPPIVIGACLWSILRRIEPMIMVPDLTKKWGANNG